MNTQITLYTNISFSFGVKTLPSDYTFEKQCETLAKEKKL